jgi:hypothetical protein
VLRVHGYPHRSYMDSLVQPGDSQELAVAILRALNGPNVEYGSVPTWHTSCNVFEHALSNISDVPNSNESVDI